MKVEKIETDNSISNQIETTIDNKLEILKFSAQVQSRIKKDISEDFILAKLSEKDKEGIIEMTSNAYYMKKILMILKEKATKYDWNNIKKIWIKRKLNYNEKEFIQQIANAVFDSYLNKIYMTVILNRNVSNNYILNILAGNKEDDNNEESEINSMKEKLGELMKPNEIKN